MGEAGRTRRVVAGVGSVAVLATGLATALPHLLAGPVTVLPMPDYADVSEVPVEPLITPPPGCPGAELQPQGTYVQVDWAPLVTANGRQYLGDVAHGQVIPAEAVVTITCDIMALSGGGQAIVPQPWPDGSSTVLAEGTVVRAIASSPRACYLTADDGYQQWLFSAVDEFGDQPSECRGEPRPG